MVLRVQTRVREPVQVFVHRRRVALALLPVRIVVEVIHQIVRGYKRLIVPVHHEAASNHRQPVDHVPELHHVVFEEEIDGSVIVYQSDDLGYFRHEYEDIQPKPNAVIDASEGLMGRPETTEPSSAEDQAMMLGLTDETETNDAV